MASLIFIGIMIGPYALTYMFTTDKELVELAPPAITIVFLITPLIPIQLIGAAYFQAIGKAKPALFLTLTRQGLFLIPLALLLPNYYGVMGIWYAFPLADFLSATVTAIALKREMSQLD
jgi:Na+-driven multidrug efflux pump